MANFGNAAGGALTGAGLGAMFGPIGAGIGGLGGGLLGLFGGSDVNGRQSKMKPFNKQGLQSLIDLLQGGGLQDNPLYGAGSSFLQNLLSGSPEAFQNFEAPYLQQFNEQIVPGIAERFAGAGTGAGAGSSSALFNSLSQAGRSLQTDLAGLRSGLQMQALPQALGYAQQPLSNILNAAQALPGQYYERPGQAGFLQGLGQAGGFGLGQSLGGGMNPFGGLSGLFGGLSKPGRPGDF